MEQESKAFNKMTASEIKLLFKEVIEKIEKINSFSTELEKIRERINEINEKINGENGLVLNINKSHQGIIDVYNEILVDNESGDSIKTQFNSALEEVEAGKKKFEELERKIFGYVKKDNSGETQKIIGLCDEIDNFYKKQQEKYQALYKQIEEDLKAGATSVNLSKSFADKVTEYRRSSRFWSLCFVPLLFSLIIYYGVITLSTNGISTADDVWRHLAFRAPFLVFAVWLAIFFGNRRAESKKLEELYKHKEVMARSFVGYKQAIEELNDKDIHLLKQHMENLLKAIGENSASFLNSEGDKHPIFEILSSFFRSKKNVMTEKTDDK
jgi:methyl-accepting chemotaxis protein